MLQGGFEPRIEQPKGMRAVGECVHFGVDVLLGEKIDHFVASGMETGLSATDKEHGYGMFVDVENGRCFFPSVGSGFEGAA